MYLQPSKVEGPCSFCLGNLFIHPWEKKIYPFHHYKDINRIRGWLQNLKINENSYIQSVEKAPGYEIDGKQFCNMFLILN